MRFLIALITALGLVSAPSLGVRAGELIPAEEQQLLDAFNQARDDVASGLEGSLPTAANMTKLVWDDTLALVAQTWANTCTVGRNPNRLSQYQSAGGSALSVGEILFTTTSAVGVPDAAVSSWLSQASAYTYGPFTSSDLPTAGNYLQIAWADTTRVGCAQTTCFGLFGALDGEILICDFVESGLVVGEEPYVDGPTASSCPASHPVVENGLCVALANPPPPTTIQLTSGLGTGFFYYALRASYNVVDVNQMEIFYNGSWNQMVDDGTGLYQFGTSQGLTTPLTPPLSIRLHSVLGETLTTSDFISNVGPNTTWDFGQQFQTCGDAIVDAGEECDDGNRVSGDGCWETCELEDELVLYGTGTGGSVEIFFGDVATGQSAFATTLAGTAASQVVFSLASDANANPTLQTLGFEALALGNRFVTNGVIDSYVIADSGLGDTPPPPPTTIQLTVGAGVSVWFLPLTVDNNAAPVVQAEVFHDGTWWPLTDLGGGAYQFDVASVSFTPLLTPLSVRLTSSLGETLTMNALITDFTPSTVWDTGQQFTVPVCGNGTLEFFEECDDGNTTVGDGCYSTCEIEDVFSLYGTAVGGGFGSGFVELVFGAPSSETFLVNTVSGNTAEQLLDLLVTAVNDSAVHQSLGISAVRVGNRLVTNGDIDAATINDAGLRPNPTLVPMLSPAGWVALVTLIGLGGALRASRCRQ